MSFITGYTHFAALYITISKSNICQNWPVFCTQIDKRPYYDFRRICTLVYPFDIVLASGHHHADPTSIGVVDSAAFPHTWIYPGTDF
jgi:hypothetical protein